MKCLEHALLVVSAPQIVSITIHFFKKENDVKGNKNKFKTKTAVEEGFSCPL